ncbi:DUF192 domain-containing protein [Nesterenkonia muleiensis]|uniref:DUF192 domain-containing protein n=1 Tax=Nesterenkonia muleiensis TaxID=2282648 RepID=UPI000E7704EE|nr:DUF192 domain-containing protein [Nesterenkonia muleiensis]
MTTIKDLPKRARSVRISADDGLSVDVPHAGTFFRRLRGLLFGGDQLLLNPCASVHGIGLRRSLDVAYIAPDGKVLEVATIRPWAAHRPRRGAKVAWEAPAGKFSAMGIAAGTSLRFRAA